MIKTSVLVALLALITVASCKKKDIEGCRDPKSLNYNPDATIDDGSCTYEVDRFVGNWQLTDTTINQLSGDTTVNNRTIVISRIGWNRLKIATVGENSCLADVFAIGSGNALTISAADNDTFYCNNAATISGSGNLNGTTLRLTYFWNWFMPNLGDISASGTATRL